MKSSTFSFKDNEGFELFTYCCEPEDLKKARAVVQVVHGLAEHAARYERFANFATEKGFIVVAFLDDHRGYWENCKTKEDLGFIGANNWFFLVWLMMNINLPG